MATKDNNIPSNGKQHLFMSKTQPSFTSDPQYNNLNLNQNHKYSSIPDKVISSNSNRVFQVVLDRRDCGDSQLQEKSSTVNGRKPSSIFSPNFCLDYNKESSNRWKYNDKDTSTNNSTLSLHIAAYENVVEASDLNRCGLKSSGEFGKTMKNIKNLFNDSSLVYQTSFELPRQQKSNNTKPAIMQFKSSQRLFNPNAAKVAAKHGQPKREVSKETKADIQNFLRRTAIHPKYPPPPPPAMLERSKASTVDMTGRGQLVMEDMLKEVQNLVDGLKSKNEVAEWCLAQGNVVTDKLAVMKEYNQEVGFVNTFHAPEGRANLVASLQHESRQIQALQEENRQLEYAIEEMEHGMEMMMARHREIILNCKRSDKMMDLLAKLQLTPTPSNIEKTMEMAKLLQECIDEHAEENTKHLEEFARLKTENSVLRILLHASSAENLKIDSVIDKLKDGRIPEDLISKYFSGKKMDENEEESNKVIEVPAEPSDSEAIQTTEISSKSNIPTPKSSKPNVSKTKIQVAGTSKN